MAALDRCDHTGANSGAIVRGDGHAFRFLAGAEDPSDA